ncbi:MAG: amidohydrolase family protein [Proteobacteria bacterium]|nr:amidohydrolase family protein [Pseudomonadota bacterium]
MDLILANACVDDAPGAPLLDIGIEDGRIVALVPQLRADARRFDVGGRLVTTGLVESHIHLDKSCILERCRAQRGDLEEAIGEVARAKATFTAEDVYTRGKRTLEKALVNGTMLMRTQVEVDPGIGLRGFEGVQSLIREYRWAIDIEICVFPQEGLLNNPGTEDLMVAALENGATVVGAAPYTDTDPAGQIDRVFALAQRFDVDVDMHLDFGADAAALDLDYVCEKTERHRWGGRVTVGHVTKLSTVPPARLSEVGRRMANAGVALTVLPSTDLFLMGRHQDHAVIRGVTPAHLLLREGVNCSLSTNNVLNPFTPFGDCSLVRMANLYANICQVGSRDDMIECYEMISRRAAALMRRGERPVAVGSPADLLVHDCTSRAQAVSEIAQPLWGFKRGRLSFTRPVAELHRPSEANDA